MFGNFGKNLNKLKIQGKIGKLWEKIRHLEKNGNREIIVNLEFF